MCGIIGYTGENNAVPYLLKGLHRLEYRGYDSSGIALQKGNEIFALKRQGKITELEKAVSNELFSFCGIGHTRWATHGKPSQKNAHPHLSRDGSFAVVHNGIIENADTLKEALREEGFTFISDTDTEVISQLLEKNYKGDIISCLRETAKLLSGSYALAIIHKDYPKTIFCAKKDSTLLVCSSNRGAFVASDTLAVSEYCKDYYCLDDGELAKVCGEKITFFNQDGKEIKKTLLKIKSTAAEDEKNGFPHYMLKEIYEQPSALKSTLKEYIRNGDVKFPEADISDSYIRGIDKIHIVGCGSAYYAGLYGKYITEAFTSISTSAHIASEFRYSGEVLDEHSLVIVISQSGETADSIAAMKKAEASGAKTLCIVNVESSTMTKSADMIIYTKAGREIAVATTKAYLCQVTVIYLLAVFLGRRLGKITLEEYQKHIRDLEAISELTEKQLKISSTACEVADEIKDAEHIYFIGRGTDYALCLEGALKLKEISYIHCEAYPAGELKHGTISLIEKGTPVIAVCLREDILPKTLSNIKEVKSRGAHIIALTKDKFRDHFDDDDTLISICDEIGDDLSLIPGAVSLQLLSYHTAVKRDCEIDKPRNLAKSVTVE